LTGNSIAALVGARVAMTAGVPMALAAAAICPRDFYLQGSSNEQGGENVRRAIQPDSCCRTSTSNESGETGRLQGGIFARRHF
jgi:hypothetical protein